MNHLCLMFDGNILFERAASVSLQLLDWPTLAQKGIKVFMRRDDQISPLYSGNKYYKLFFNLKQAEAQGAQAMLSFGGMYSNHLYALAALGKAYGFPTVGIVRGHRPVQAIDLTVTLRDAKKWGMELYFLSRKDYQKKDISSILSILKKRFAYIMQIPEGGCNLSGVRGCMVMARTLKQQLTQRGIAEGQYSICCACGTGTTLAGIVAALPQVPCLGINVLKGSDTLSPEINRYLHLLQCDARQWCIISGYHHGGYARMTLELKRWMIKFEERNQLLLDPVYTVKLLWAIEQLALANYWPEGHKLIAIHTGGLQGRRGYNLNISDT